MVKLYAHLPRDQFHQKLRPAAQAEQSTVKRARFALPCGITVTVRGPELTLGGAIDCLMHTVRELKRSQAKKLDIAAAQRLMKKNLGGKHVQLAEETDQA
jgi:hypothetical protein